MGDSPERMRSWASPEYECVLRLCSERNHKRERFQPFSTICHCFFSPVSHDMAWGQMKRTTQRIITCPMMAMCFFIRLTHWFAEHFRWKTFVGSQNIQAELHRIPDDAIFGPLRPNKYGKCMFICVSMVAIIKKRCVLATCRLYNVQFDRYPPFGDQGTAL